MSIQNSGRGKEVLTTENPSEIIIKFTDEATAFHDVKKGVVPGKGAVINEISIAVFTFLEEKGIPTHFLKKVSPAEQLAKKVRIIPLNVVVRNVIAGSIAKRIGVEEGYLPKTPIYELFYKDSYLGNPLINEDHAIALGFSNPEELAEMREVALKINAYLVSFFAKIGIQLVDFKIEFGRDENGQLVLADEISPDKARLWDKQSHRRLDKDRFRQDLGDIKEAYEEVLRRINKGREF